jgi:micrococcal nuclease
MLRMITLIAAMGWFIGDPALAQLGLPKGETRVVHVIDGDTIRVSDLKASVRMRGYDAPEIHKNRISGYKCDAEKELGLKSKARLEELVAPPHKVVVKRSTASDDWGRRVATVTSDGTDVGDTLTAEGLAKPWKPGDPKPDWCAPAPAGK